jgi:uncharacterized membrane protein YGL010W
MRTRDQFLSEYAKSHRNSLNKIIHMICVPTIFFSTAGLLWCVPVGKIVPGLPADVAPWVNLATLVAIPIIVFYARLGPGTLLTGLAWMTVTFAGCIALDYAQLPWSWAWLCAGLWLAAWVGQFYGHHVERAKPSFGDDLIFLLIGPLFVQQEFGRLVRTGTI